MATTRRGNSRKRNQNIIISLTKNEALTGALIGCVILVALGFFWAKAFFPISLMAWEKNRLEAVGSVYNELRTPPTLNIPPVAIAEPELKKDKPK
jgi:hypothetical protein